MNRKMKFRLPSEEFYMYEVFEVGVRRAEFFSETLRCPFCGVQAFEEDVVAGMRQFSLPLDMLDYDLWILLAKCHECGKRYAYQAMIDPDV